MSDTSPRAKKLRKSISLVKILLVIGGIVIIVVGVLSKIADPAQDLRIDIAFALMTWLFVLFIHQSGVITDLSAQIGETSIDNVTLKFQVQRLSRQSMDLAFGLQHLIAATGNQNAMQVRILDANGNEFFPMPVLDDETVQDVSDRMQGPEGVQPGE